MSAHHIKINTRGKTRKEFAKDLSSSISEIQMLLYERRALDLDEEQSYALFVITDLQQQLIQKGGRK